MNYEIDEDPPSYGLQKRAYARVGDPWTSEEERMLKTAFFECLSIEEMMHAHGRTKNGIETRLERMGLSIHDRDMVRQVMPTKHYQNPLVKKESSYVNMQHLITLLQKGYTTIEVGFLHGGEVTSGCYTYKVSDAVKDTLASGDLVVVEGKNEIKVAKVMEIHKEPQIDVKSPFALKWIVCKVDRAAYDDQMAREKEAIKLIEVAERRAAQEKALQEILGHTDRAALMALINGTEVQPTPA